MNNALSKAVNRFGGFIVQKSPTILLVLGIGGCVSATVIAIKETPKAVKLIEKRKEELKTEKLDVKEIVRTTWKLYLPVVVTGTLSIACVIFSHSINERRKAALATAYAIAETSMAEYRDQIREKLGEETEQSIVNAIEEKHANDILPPTGLVLVGDEDYFIEGITRQVFKSTKNDILSIVNYLNAKMRNEQYITLNEYLSELGLDPSDIGDFLEWHIDLSGYIDVKFVDSHLKNGHSAISITYNEMPRGNFRYM